MFDPNYNICTICGILSAKLFVTQTARPAYQAVRILLAEPKTNAMNIRSVIRKGKCMPYTRKILKCAKADWEQYPDAQYIKTMSALLATRILEGQSKFSISHA